MNWMYFHRMSPRVSWLDHRLTPEVRACLAAMMSRAPKGGIEARYTEIVDAVARDLFEAPSIFASKDEAVIDWDSVGEIGRLGWRVDAERRLCTYPLHPKVQGFFDKFVGSYGHASIQELTGEPVVFVEGISQGFAYLSFDNPLVAGQEMSTRAMWRENWQFSDDLPQDPDLLWLHETGLRIAKAEVDAWKAELQEKCDHCGGVGARIFGDDVEDCPHCDGTGRKYPWMKDPQPFRPAFDRARWALPSTISTGVVHTANVRVMARVYRQLRDVMRTAEAADVLCEVRQAYEEALPGIAPHAFAREDICHELPAHLSAFFGTDLRGIQIGYEPGEGEVDVRFVDRVHPHSEGPRFHGYLDPVNNHQQVEAAIYASWAADRDWHRHRVAYPLSVRPVITLTNASPLDNLDVSRVTFILHRAYEPLSEIGKAEVAGYFARAARTYFRFLESGDLWTALAALPFGAATVATFRAGRRDATYIMELRADPPGGGANFEYQGHARTALKMLRG